MTPIETAQRGRSAIARFSRVFARESRLGRAALLLPAVFALAACGGGGGSSTIATPTVGTVVVAGKATYTDYDVGAGGIDYASPTARPIRGAIVELESPPGTVLFTGTTSPAGSYLFSGVPASASIRVVVKAALGAPAAPDTRVIDNTNGGSLYEVSKSASTGTTGLSLDFNADSGWDGTRYASTRAASPFAILDVIYQGQQLLRSVDASIVFPPLDVNWSVANKPAATLDPAVGDIPSTAFDRSTKVMYVMGAADIDTDEYDSHVIAHEWVHYVQEHFSRTDSTGGDHTFAADILQPSIAFDEGLGNAMAGMILNDPKMVLTSGPGQKTATVFDLDGDTVPDTDQWGSTGVLLDGYYSEVSIMEVLWDLFDAGPGDDDAVSAGFAPIYKALTNGHKNTDAYTSIFSFLTALKHEAPAQGAAIDALVQGENIGRGGYDEFQDLTHSSLPPLYTDVDPAGGLTTLDANGDPLQVAALFGPVTATEPGNKLLNQRFFRFTAPSDGCFRLAVSPDVSTASADLFIGFPGLSGVINRAAGGGTETYAFDMHLGDIGTYLVGALSSPALFNTRMTRVGNVGDAICQNP